MHRRIEILLFAVWMAGLCPNAPAVDFLAPESPLVKKKQIAHVLPSVCPADGPVLSIEAQIAQMERQGKIQHVHPPDLAPHLHRVMRTLDSVEERTGVYTAAAARLSAAIPGMPKPSRKIMRRTVRKARDLLVSGKLRIAVVPIDTSYGFFTRLHEIVTKEGADAFKIPFLAYRIGDTVYITRKFFMEYRYFFPPESSAFASVLLHYAFLDPRVLAVLRVPENGRRKAAAVLQNALDASSHWNHTVADLVLRYYPHAQIGPMLAAHELDPDNKIRIKARNVLLDSDRVDVIAKQFMQEARALLPQGEDGLQAAENFLTALLPKVGHKQRDKLLDYASQALAEDMRTHFPRFFQDRYPRNANETAWIWLLALQRQGVLTSPEKAAQFAGTGKNAAYIHGAFILLERLRQIVGKDASDRIYKNLPGILDELTSNRHPDTYHQEKSEALVDDLLKLTVFGMTSPVFSEKAQITVSAWKSLKQATEDFRQGRGPKVITMDGKIVGDKNRENLDSAREEFCEALTTAAGWLAFEEMVGDAAPLPVEPLKSSRTARAIPLFNESL